MENGGSASWTAGENSVEIVVTTETSTKTYSVTVTYTPAENEPAEEPGG